MCLWEGAWGPDYILQTGPLCPWASQQTCTGAYLTAAQSQILGRVGELLVSIQLVWSEETDKQHENCCCISWLHYPLLSWGWSVKKADHQRSKFGRDTVIIWERNHTVTRGTPGTCSSLHTLPSATEWGLAPTQVEPVIRDSKELQPICVCAQSCVIPWSVATRLLCPWNFPGKNTGVGSHFLLQGSSGPRDWTQVSCIGRHIMYHWTI